MERSHYEEHYVARIGWLRAAVLGANDGIVSTASLVLGVAAAGADAKAILVAGVAGLVAGAMSMAAGEYVSVSSQSDTEQADLAREREELATSPVQEHAELTGIYVKRGLDKALAAGISAPNSPSTSSARRSSSKPVLSSASSCGERWRKPLRRRRSAGPTKPP